MKNLNELDKELIKADKMDTAVVREILTEINSADIPKLNYDKIRSNLFSKKPKFARTKRIAIIAAVSIMMLMLMSATGYIILKSIIFDGFEANKVDAVIYNGKNVGAIWEYEITDPKVKIEPKIGNVTDIYFETIEKAAEHLDFTPKTPGYFPEGYSFEYVKLSKYNDKYNQNSCEIWYRHRNSGGLYNVDGFDVLVANYVGENATIKITTTSADIEKITLNDGTEALLEAIVNFSNGNSLYQLHWIKDGVGYILGNSFAKDELIKMAESIK